METIAFGVKENTTTQEVNEEYFGKGVDPFYLSQRDTLVMQHP